MRLAGASDRRRRVAWGAALVLVLATTPPVAASDEHQTLLDRYCLACHNDRLETGSLSIEGLAVADVAARPDVWERVLDKVRTRAMPPPRRPRPDDAAYGALATYLETELDAAAARHLDPGRPTIHRLNQLEYTNAVRDLLGLEIDAGELLPADDIAYGFDNNADILTVAPGMLETYMSAARRVSRLAVGDPAIEADVVRYPVSSLLVQDGQMGEALPFGSRGGAAVRHHFPLDGEYVLRLALRENRGRREPQEIDVRVDGARVGLLRLGEWPAHLAGIGEARVVEAGAPLVVRVPVRAGTRVVSATFTARTFAPEGVAPAHMPVWTFQTGRGYEERMALDSLEVSGPYQPDTIAPVADGDVDTTSRRQIFSCRPEPSADAAAEEACAVEILSRVARGAFRRPVARTDADGLLAFYREGREDGTFDRGIQRGLESILVDPEFLFRIERDPAGLPPGTPYRLSDLELASRLSFFLWGTVPDAELLDLAIRRRLSEPDVLEQQVRRLVAHDRSDVLVTSFAAQWLHLRRMRSVAPDVSAFPAFDENLRDALVRETELFVRSQIRDDRSVVDLLTADYTFVNERLARHYGIPNVYGSRFRKVTPPDEARRGLLGQGSILTVTSLATRTSPVVRGKWVLENLLGTPPPPPPPDVPDLPERAESGEVTSVRERLEQHRANPVCASCHARMDPLGFALENFDAVGKWRDEEADIPIDATGQLPDGTTFAGLPELREVLVSRRDEFVTTVTEKLLTYALGRGVTYHDRPAIRAIVRDAAADEHRWSSIILGVVRSVPFQMRRTES